MTLIDRFICRREGHIPAVTITKSTVPFTMTVNTCKRCGKAYEPPPMDEPPTEQS